MTTVVTIFCFGLAAVALGAFVIYNRLVTARQQVREAWAVIDVELERRHTLIPQLVESVTAAAAHERDTLDRLLAADAAARQAPATAADRSRPEHDLGAAARAVVALRQAYPQLDSQQNFLRLQHDLAITEDRLGAARRFYNFKVAELNRQVQSFPSSLMARRAGFSEAAYFDPD